jgi:hypothetical protein
MPTKLKVDGLKLAELNDMIELAGTIHTTKTEFVLLDHIVTRHLLQIAVRQMRQTDANLLPLGF